MILLLTLCPGVNLLQMLVEVEDGEREEEGTAGEEEE